MILYVLLQERDGWVNVTDVFASREEAIAKKRERELLEEGWVLYSRFKYTIVEKDALQLVRESFQ